ncbi:DNA-binding response regulator [Micromonospora sonchi]|uniref:DNA-binding response regulator n=1 Tax=Micromonospora sonchi TaxID=1763543 RepID=A0A917WPS0_9ACTN|nr:response regulator transcription factor [Micromonospora sonchi]GGM19813.1 DNA-binding response regulator [Micromonospora sonchi]
MSIRLLLVDDQPLVRAGIRMLLDAEADLTVVGEASDGAEAVRLARDLQPDVVLMDVRMPGVDGVTATGEICGDDFSVDPDRPVRVLILTTYHVDETVYAALRAGASGFVLKDAVPQELLGAVRAVAVGEAWLDPAVARGLLTDFVGRLGVPATTPERLGRLTAREREVLVTMAYGLSNSEIAARLVVGEATVKTHVSRVLMKLGLRDRAQAVAVAYQSGLVTPGAAPPR